MKPGPVWYAGALCLGRTEAFDDEHEATVIEAKAVCTRCPVRAACLDRGLFEPWGVWGGLTTEERRALVKRLKVAS